MLIQERLHLILKMHSITPAAFADKLGVQRSNVSHVLSGRNKPGLDFLNKIILNFPRVNAHWLLSGEMPAGLSTIKEEKEPELNSVIQHRTITQESKDNEIVKIVEFYADGSFKEYYPNKQ
jgi:transcriptional regulator with XRE-family HTH domain